MIASRTFYIAIACIPALWLAVQLARKVGRPFLPRRGLAQETARADRPIDPRKSLAGVVDAEMIQRQRLRDGSEGVYDDEPQYELGA